MPLEFLTPWQIVVQTAAQFLPVWVAMIVIMGTSALFRYRLGTYGRIFDSGIGTLGFALVLFWLLTAILAPDGRARSTPTPSSARCRTSRPAPSTPCTGLPYLFGGDALGRDVFSRMVYGSRTVMAIAPLATLFAYMVGITLGLPAGYFGGRLDTVLSFLANLVLAFPVILLFYLLVTPEIRETAIPGTMAAVLFVFPVIFVDPRRLEPLPRAPRGPVARPRARSSRSAPSATSASPASGTRPACADAWRRTPSTSSSPWSSSPRRRSSASSAASPSTSRPATTSPPPRPAASARGTSCSGRSSRTPAAR